MKNRRIKGDWGYSIVIYFIIIMLLFLLLLAFISFAAKTLIPLLLFALPMVLFGIIGIYLTNVLGVNINYKKSMVHYIGYGQMRKKIKISEIDHVELQELEKNRSNIFIWFIQDMTYFTDHHEYGVGCKNVYRNGKIYDIVVYLKDGEIIKYPFTALYQSSSKKRVLKAEAKINKILDELNEYIAKTDK